MSSKHDDHAIHYLSLQNDSQTNFGQLWPDDMVQFLPPGIIHHCWCTLNP